MPYINKLDDLSTQISEDKVRFTKPTVAPNQLNLLPKTKSIL